jgi:hypothetical protein
MQRPVVLGGKTTPVGGGVCLRHHIAPIDGPLARKDVKELAARLISSGPALRAAPISYRSCAPSLFPRSLHLLLFKNKFQASSGFMLAPAQHERH